MINKQFHSLIICLYEIYAIVAEPEPNIVLLIMFIVGLTFVLSLPYLESAK